MSLGTAAILGAVQGLTEFLPVSSSGHLIVTSWFLNGQPLSNALTVGLHVGTLVAMLAYFWRDWLKLAVAFLQRLKGVRSFESDTLLPALVIGSIPAGVVGALFHHQIEDHLQKPMIVALTMTVFGILMWVADRFSASERPLDKLTIRDGILIGLAQALALVPGTSRSGITLTAGRGLKFNRADAARFSFLLGTPATAGAVLLKGKELIHHVGDPVFQVGTVTSLVVGCLAIGGFLKFLRHFGLGGFAVYRVVIAGLTIWYATGLAVP